jgi:hypothetical protein
MRQPRCVAWLSAILLSADAAFAGELTVAEKGKCDYQIVRPDEMPDAIVERAIADAADILREMFLSNGCTVPVVKESEADKQKPGIYLGNTAAARAAGIETSKLPVWTYQWKTSGSNVIIAGRDWVAANRQNGKDRPCSLGTVKGLADFMRRFCGTRFLAPGGLTGIEFLPTPTIAVPDNLAVRKEPMVNYNTGDRPATDVAIIALNLLNNVTTEYSGHTHEIAVPAEKYAAGHPEYFALVNGQRIREHGHPWKTGVMVKEPHLCYSNKDVQELIYQDMLRSIDAGYPEYLSFQADGFTPCQCDECRKMFDTADWGEKLWLLNKQWAERLLKDRPGAFLIVGSYTVTEKPPTAFKEFPPNMRINSRSTPEALAQWAEYRIPGGFTTYLHAWGGYHLCGYLPVRTPRYAEQVVRLYDKYRVKGVGLDSPPAIMWGLEGPTVYVYSRMFDDVAHNAAQQLVEEYVQAAYGPAAHAMSRLFEELHHTLEVYADVFGVDNGSFQLYTRTDGRRVRYLTWQTKLRLIGFLYPPETLTLLESQLAQAEKTPGLTDKITLRLALVRREFDYLRGTARVVHMYNAYQTQPGKSTLDQLLTEMETREKMILSWYDRTREYRPGVYLQKPIAASWPMYIGGAGYYNTHLLANGGTYLGQPVPPFTWNISEMRKAPLLAGKKMAAKKTTSPLSVEPAAWDGIPPEKLGPLSLGSAAPQWPSDVKVAYDANALYLRFEGRLPDGWVKPPEMKRDDGEIVTCESFEVVLAPDGNPSRYFHFAGGATDAARYDARRGFVEDSIDPRFNQDDVAWNPEWTYQCAVAADGKSWSASMVIPFQSLGAAAPTAGTEWKVNCGRVHQIRRYMPREVSLWSSNPGTTCIDDRKSFGTLLFE